MCAPVGTLTKVKVEQMSCSHPLHISFLTQSLELKLELAWHSPASAASSDGTSGEHTATGSSCADAGVQPQVLRIEEEYSCFMSQF